MKGLAKYLISSTFVISFLFLGCSSSSKEHVHKELELELDALNKNAPIQINENIRFDSCSIDSNNRLSYFYCITDSITPSNTFFQELENDARSKIIKDPGMATMKTKQVSMRYIYNDMQGRQLFLFEITPNDYQ